MAEASMDKAARLADVAKAAGVSQGTVSNVFSRPELVREEVREHVRAVAKSIGYRGPDPRGRMLRAGKVNAIGVASAEPMEYFFDDPYARELMRGIAEGCEARGAGLSLISARNTEKLVWNIESALVDGFVLLCIEGGEQLVELTRQRQLPFVALALGKADPTVAAIGIDDVAGAALAATHLAELGHRRFGVLSIEFKKTHSGFVSAADIEAAIYSDARDRLRGYTEALAKFGIDRDTVPVWESQSGSENVIAGLEAMFAHPDPPTALLCMSDRVALVALDWLQARGISVPHDVSVVGFDGVPEAALSTPPLTTVAQPIAEMGRRAVNAILEPKTAPTREVLPVELIVRASTAAPVRR